MFLEDYDIEIGRMLVQGCDVWLNTPRRPQEASGTSGQKSPINGGINLSILDGWWVEGYRGDNGWAIGDGPSHADAGAAGRRRTRPRSTSSSRTRSCPRFFERDDATACRRRWIETMKASIESVVPRFSAHRMVRDYVEGVYLPAAAPRR